MVRDRRNGETAPALRGSEESALSARLYEAYAPSILVYLRRQVARQEDVEDLLLEVFLAALEHEPRLTSLSEGEQLGWLLTVARNKMIDHHRRTRLRTHFPLEEARGALTDEKMPDELVVQEEEYARLNVYLQRLPIAQQEVLQLRFTAELRCAEIARILNKREGAVRTMLSRALNTLAGFYEPRDKGGAY